MKIAASRKGFSTTYEDLGEREEGAAADVVADRKELNPRPGALNSSITRSLEGPGEGFREILWTRRLGNVSGVRPPDFGRTCTAWRCP